MFTPLVQCGAVQVSGTMTHRDQFRSIYSCRKALPFPPTVIPRITNCGSAKLFGRRIRGITLSVSMLLSSLCPTKESSSIWLKIRDGWKALGMAILLRCDIDEMLRFKSQSECQTTGWHRLLSGNVPGVSSSKGLPTPLTLPPSARASAMDPHSGEYTQGLSHMP